MNEVLGGSRSSPLNTESAPWRPQEHIRTLVIAVDPVELPQVESHQIPMKTLAPNEDTGIIKDDISTF
ncbi:MAG: hypothetical protein P8L85_02785 [Rubripirellula sp.]|nr:hypothetical protein [Rubripirellula sp.]